MRMDVIDLITKILAWGFIAMAVALIVLKYFGLIHSPEALGLESLVAVGGLIELGRLEARTSFLWSDFREFRGEMTAFKGEMREFAVKVKQKLGID